MELRLYGLLHLSEVNSSAENVIVKGFSDQIEIYLNCAINLSNSLRLKNIEFTLLTNSKDKLESIKPVGANLEIKEMPFYTSVPQGINFYSAHFKLDALRYLSRLAHSYVGLCDLDMVCINDPPRSLSNIIKQGIPLCYDISDQVIPAYREEVIVRDLESIHKLESEGRWYGGEFISGPPEFFLTLVEEINRIYENYLAAIGQLRLIGDEPTTSAALEIIRKGGTYVADAGTLGIVGRFWNAKTLHQQKPFEYFEQCFLLHLPADKRFLARMSRDAVASHVEFAREYNDYRYKQRTKKGIREIAKILVPKNAVEWARSRRHAWSAIE